ncbi:MAG TPA: ABC transporter permease subunit, partial [candidate division Zixibacteria bacterium]|nr:ABC transporter permease subunit [candidate division Zixibacteria bacterium]
WYGSEWYITVFGGLILVTVTLVTILAPVLAPHDPNEFVGAPFTPPLGGLQVLLSREGESPISPGNDLSEQTIGVLRNQNSVNVAKEMELERQRYMTQEELIEGLRSGEVDLAFVDKNKAAELVAANSDLEQLVGTYGQTYLLGTDNLGRDITSRLTWGARTVLGVAISSALLSSLIGIPLGLISGFVGGKLDRGLSLVMDSIYSFPGLLLAVALAAMLGPSLVNVAIAISVVYIPTFYRVVRGQVLSAKEDLYIEAARSLGATRTSILRRYIFPNVIPSVVVVFSLNIADAILTAAGLTFIGLGLPPDVPDWGYDLSKGHQFLVSGSWWMITWPGLLIALVAAGFSLLGEGLSEILNPRLAKG